MDLTSWLEFFTEGLKAQLIEVRKKGEQAIKKDTLISKANKSGLNERQLSILLYLLENKKASVDDIQQELGLVRRTIQRDLAVMAEQKLVKEIAKSKTDPTRHYELL